MPLFIPSELVSFVNPEKKLILAAITPDGQQFLNSRLVFPEHLRATGGGNDTAWNLFGYFTLGKPAIEGVEYTPAFEHHFAFIFGECKVEQLVKVGFRAYGLKQLIEHGYD